MATITTRSGKGSPLTNNEVDANFTNLNTDKAELSGATFTGQIVAPSLDISGDIDVDGTTNLDATNIVGALDVTGTASATNVSLPDDGVLSLGTSDELTLKHHNSGYSHLTNTTGTLYIDSDSVTFRDDDGSPSNMVISQTGIDVTGSVVADGLALGDSQKATFGASDDLQIYHDGNHSYIEDAGTGSIKIKVGDFRVENASGNNLIKGVGDVATLHHAGSEKLATTSTGIDVTGTATMDGLTVNTGSYGAVGAGSGRMYGSSSHGLVIQGSGTTNDFLFLGSDGSDSFRIANNGDISFYEDTGSTPKFFWDASAESLGIGTSSPSSFSSNANNLVVGSGSGTEGITINSGSANYGTIYFADGTSGSAAYAGNINYNHADNSMRLGTNGSTTDVVIDSTGRVGIGTSSPSYPFHLSGSGDTVAAVTAGASSIAALNLGNSTNLADGGIRYDNSANALILRASNTERMRIDASGNVGIGTSSPVNNTNRTTLGLQGAWGGQLDIMVGSTVHAQFGTDNFSSGQSCRIQSQDGIVFKSGGSAERMRIDSSGRVGIGVVPSTLWSASYDALQIGLGGSIAAHDGAGHALKIGSNFVYEGLAPNYYDKYLTTATAGKYEQDNDGHKWSTAASGTAGGVISWQERMRIDSSGNVQIKSAGKLQAFRSDNARSILVYTDNNASTVESDTDPLKIKSADRIQFETGGANERLRIDSSGNVGIGTSSPVKDFVVSNGGAEGFEVDAGALTNLTEVLAYNRSGATWNALRTSASQHEFYVNGTERMRIDSAGRVLVGKSGSAVGSAGAELQSGAGANAAIIGTASVQPLILNRLSTDGAIAQFRKDGTTVGSIGVVASNDLSVNATDELNLQVGGATKALIASNGSLYLYAQATGAGNADLRYATGSGQVTYDTSSRLVKAEIEDIPYGLSTVMALSPKRYERTDSDNKLEVGFIADEVVEVVPELVGMMEKRFLTMNQEDTEVIAGSVEYNKMTAVLVKAIQEQQNLIETLTARIAALEE